MSDRQVEVPITIDSQLSGNWFTAASSHSKEEEEDDARKEDDDEEWIAVRCSNRRARQLSSAPTGSPKKRCMYRSTGLSSHNYSLVDF